MSGGRIAVRLNSVGLACVLMSAMGAGGCSQVGGLGSLTAGLSKANETSFPGQTDPRLPATATASDHATNPRDPQAALAHARQLRAAGDKAGAFAVLQQASQHHGGHREIASEYGRLALEFDQLDLATKMLAVADDPARPDWRIASARGTALARKGQFKEAIGEFERADGLSPDNPTVTNNLALAIAATGDAKRAEALLQRAVAGRPDDAKIRRNLALLASLQGRDQPAAVPVAAPPARQVQPQSQPTAVRSASAPIRPAPTTTAAVTRSELAPPVPVTINTVDPPAKSPAVAGWSKTTVTSTAATKSQEAVPAAKLDANAAPRIELPREALPSSPHWPAGRRTFD